MYTLVLLVIVNSNVSLTTVEFNSSAKCMKAIDTMLELEKYGYKIKARCVQND
jgi:hypothetical protein